MNTTVQTRGPIHLGQPKPRRVEAYMIPDLEQQLRDMQNDLNAVAGTNDEFDWSAPWIDTAIVMLELKATAKR